MIISILFGIMETIKFHGSHFKVFLTLTLLLNNQFSESTPLLKSRSEQQDFDTKDRDFQESLNRVENAPFNITSALLLNSDVEDFSVLESDPEENSSNPYQDILSSTDDEAGVANNQPALLARLYPINSERGNDTDNNEETPRLSATSGTIGVSSSVLESKSEGQLPSHSLHNSKPEKVLISSANRQNRPPIVLSFGTTSSSSDESDSLIGEVHGKTVKVEDRQADRSVSKAEGLKTPNYTNETPNTRGQIRNASSFVDGRTSSNVGTTHESIELIENTQKPQEGARDSIEFVQITDIPADETHDSLKDVEYSNIPLGADDESAEGFDDKQTHVIGADEYVDNLYMSMVSRGLPDSFREREIREPEVRTTENMFSEHDPVTKSSLDITSSGHKHNIITSTPSNAQDRLYVGQKMESSPERREKNPDITIERKTDNVESDGLDIQTDQSDSARAVKQEANVIQLPNGVVIDALFDNIDSLQDQLDVCEEGLRQRMVVHKDVFFGNSGSLKEADEYLGAQTQTTFNDEYEYKPEVDVQEEVDRRTVTHHVTTVDAESTDFTKRTTTGLHPNHNEHEGNIDEEEEHTNDTPTDEKKTQKIDAQKLQFHEHKNLNQITIDNTLDNENEAGKENEEILTKTTDVGHSYTVIARTLIKRLSGRLRYLEQCIEGCNHLTQAMEKIKIPP